MTITSVNEGLWTEDITSGRTRNRDRPDVHGTKLTMRFYRRRAGASVGSRTRSTQFLRLPVDVKTDPVDVVVLILHRFYKDPVDVKKVPVDVKKSLWTSWYFIYTGLRLPVDVKKVPLDVKKSLWTLYQNT